MTTKSMKLKSTSNRISIIPVFVCRAGYSGKNSLKYGDELRKEGKLKNWLLPVNDVTDINLYDYLDGYRYRQSYYGYGNRQKIGSPGSLDRL